MKFTNIKIEQPEISLVPEPMHRVIVVDCSGSMYGELPKLRTYLKNRLTSLVQPQDRLSIIWFSGRNQCGVLLEAMTVETLADVARVNTAIDRFLQATGLTGFRQPLLEVLELLNRVPMPISMNFLTDGGENQNTVSEVLEVCRKLDGAVAGSTFVEFGYYADHQMLMKMAEAAAGQVIMAEDFERYSESIETTLTGSTSSKKIKIPGVTAEFVVANLPNGYQIAKPDAIGLVTLPAETLSYSMLSSGEFKIEESDCVAACNMVAALIQRGSMVEAMDLAGAIGDRALYSQVENSFSKQDYALSVELAKGFGSDKLKLFDGTPRNTGMVTKPDAFCVLDMLTHLANTDGNSLDLSHPEFQYRSIGGKRDVLVQEDGFKPVFTDSAERILAPISALKFDEDRPNISILVRRPGHVSLPDNEFGLGNSFDTFIWRSYTIVRDGIVNLRKIPMVLSKVSYDLLHKNGLISEPFKINHTYVIDTRGLPIINRNMANPGTIENLFRTQFRIYELKSIQKYLKSLVDKPEVSVQFSDLYGAEAAAFLKQYGIGPGGFGPKTTKGESPDPYMAKAIEVKLSSLSGIPKIEDARKAIAANKVTTPSLKVMADIIGNIKVGTEDEILEQLRLNKIEIEKNMSKLIMSKFGAIIGKRWFDDCTSIDDNTRELDFGLGKMIVCKVEMVDKEV